MGSGSEPRKHRLLLELGRGGMGTVYLAATHGPAGFEKLKVVKRLRSGMVEDAQFLQMFLEEARLAARLNHPNVVQTNEVGFDGHDYFIEMEYLEGQPVNAVMRRAAKEGGLPLVLAMWVLTQVLAGLEYAHALTDHGGRPLGIVHRDVSPHNVFVTYDGVVKILDLGIAKAADSSSETRSGMVKGKATYMSPEQAMRRPLDGRSDVFAVGVMMWELLTGKRLWEGLQDGEIFQKLAAGEIPRARDAAPGVDERLDAICSKALAAKVEDRWPSAGQMQAALEEWLEASGEKFGQRAVGKWVAEAFSQRREATRREIDAQLRAASEGSDRREVDVPALGASPAYQATNTGDTKGREKPSGDRATVAAAPKSLRDLAAAEDAGGAGTSDDLEHGEGDGRLDHRRDSTRTTGIASTAPPARTRRVAAGTAWAVAALAVAAGVVLVAQRLRHSDPAAVPPAQCATAAGCVAEHNGAPFICRRSDHVCVPLESEDCHVNATAAEIADDDTLWVGVMFPYRDMNYAPGWTLPLWEVHAVQLAQSDFAKATGGIPRPDNPKGPRPFATIVCDDQAAPTRAAKHLAEEVRVPAVIGFGSGAEAMDLLTHVFLPNRTLVVDSRTVSPLLSAVPMPSDAPRLLWRTDPSSHIFADAARTVVEQIVAPSITARMPRETAGQGLRLAILKGGSMDTSADVDYVLDRLTLNGEDYAHSQGKVRVFEVPSHDGPPDDSLRAQWAKLTADLIAFKPHIALIDHGWPQVWTNVLPGLESSAGASAPWYVLVSALTDPALLKFASEGNDRRRRILGLEFNYKTPATARFLQHYGEAFSDELTPASAPTTSYDAAYVVAMAAGAIGDGPITGVSLARAVERLQPPGTAVSVGPSTILDAMNTLRTGKNLDLVGASGGLDFDMKTGDARIDLIVDCLAPTIAGEGPARTRGGVDSGASYEGASGKILGHLNCP